MKREKAFDIVKSGILDVDPDINVQKITEATSLKHGLGFDSLDIVELSIAIQDKVGDTINDSEFERLSFEYVIVKDIVDIVEKV